MDEAVTHMFRDFDLQVLGVPQEAWPTANGVYKGSKSFTIRSRSGAVSCLNMIQASLWAPNWISVCIFGYLLRYTCKFIYEYIYIYIYIHIHIHNHLHVCIKCLFCAKVIAITISPCFYVWFELNRIYVNGHVRIKIIHLFVNVCSPAILKQWF